MRRLTLVCAIVVLSVGAPDAVAGAGPDRGIPSACAKPQHYPPVSGANIQVSTTRVTIGDQLTVAGAHFCGDERVTISIAGDPATAVHTDVAGAFAGRSIVVHGKPGRKQVCGTGASGVAADRDCIAIRAFAYASGQSRGKPHTAITGGQIALVCALGLLLLAGGVAASTAGRSARAHT